MSEAPTLVFQSERRAAVLSLTVGVVLLAIKFAAYFLTGSAAIFSDALESIVNVLASGFAVYSIILAHAPADEKHPYGHGKIEFLAAGFEGGMILLAAVVIAGKAIADLYRGTQPEQVNFGLILIVVAMVVNGAAGFYLIGSGKRHGSITLEADGKHLLADAVTSAAVLIALAIVKIFRLPIADPIAALLIAVYISMLSIGLLRRSAAGLMDQQDLADDAKIRQILDSHLAPAGKEPHICSYHKLRHRHSGRYHWVDFHIMVPGNLNIDQGHHIASSIEYEIEQALGEGNATAHVEPCADQHCASCAKK
jgi:cation diffusion facilitator family transporter